MLKLGILSVVLLSATAMAEPSYMAECRAAAIKKLGAQAQAKGAHLQSRSVKVIEINDRWYNPSKYVWFEGEATDVSVSVAVHRTPGFERTEFSRSLDFYNQHTFLLQGSELLRLDVPSDASVAFWNHAGADHDTLLLELRSDFVTPGRTYPRGALLAADAPAYLRGERRFDLLFEPTATCSLASFTTTRSCVLLGGSRAPLPYRRCLLSTSLGTSSSAIAGAG